MNGLPAISPSDFASTYNSGRDPHVPQSPITPLAVRIIQAGQGATPSRRAAQLPSSPFKQITIEPESESQTVEQPSSETDLGPLPHPIEHLKVRLKSVLSNWCRSHDIDHKEGLQIILPLTRDESASALEMSRLGKVLREVVRSMIRSPEPIITELDKLPRGESTFCRCSLGSGPAQKKVLLCVSRDGESNHVTLAFFVLELREQEHIDQLLEQGMRDLTVYPEPIPTTPLKPKRLQELQQSHLPASPQRKLQKAAAAPVDNRTQVLIQSLKSRIHYLNEFPQGFTLDEIQLPTLNMDQGLLREVLSSLMDPEEDTFQWMLTALASKQGNLFTLCEITIDEDSSLFLLMSRDDTTKKITIRMFKFESGQQEAAEALIKEGWGSVETRFPDV